jgi:hypothetical protein
LTVTFDTNQDLPDAASLWTFYLSRMRRER